MRFKHVIFVFLSFFCVFFTSTALAFITVTVNGEPLIGDKKKENKKDLLRKAINDGDLKSVKLALENREIGEIDIDLGEGTTPLMRAVRKGDLSITKWLVQNGANVNAESIYQWTPLMFAASGASVTNQDGLAIATLLIKHGAHVNHRSIEKKQSFAASLATISDHLDPSTPLMQSITKATIVDKDIKVVKLLVQHGAVIDKDLLKKAIYYEQRSVMEFIHHHAVKQGVLLDQSERHELFVKLASRNKLDGMRWMLEKGININATTDYQRTALLACLKGWCWQSKENETLIFLIQNGADVNAYGGRTKGNAETPLTLAVKKRKLEWIRILLANGANPNLENANGESAIDVARIRKNKYIDKRDSLFQMMFGSENDDQSYEKKIKEADEIITMLEGAIAKAEERAH